jgi:hypothetical protein
MRHTDLTYKMTGKRQQWGQGEFPFGFVQLANYRAAQGDPSLRNPWRILARRPWLNELRQKVLG